MALDADILALVKRVQNTRIRQGNVFVLSDDGLAAVTLGRVRGVFFRAAPVLSERDSTGRQSTMGYDITVQIIMMQTEGADLDGAFALGAPGTGDDGQNGFNVFLADEPMSTATAITEWATPTKGIKLKNALIQVSPDINFSGEEGGITLTINGIVTASALLDFSTNKTVTFDA